MSILRLEDLFVAIVFVIAMGVTGWAVVESNEASPLVTPETVVMERPNDYERAPACRDDADLYLARTF